MLFLKRFTHGILFRSEHSPIYLPMGKIPFRIFFAMETQFQFLHGSANYVVGML